MLESIGMTPRQITVMTVTSMASLGAIGTLFGIPLGAAGRHLWSRAWRKPSASPCPPV